MPIPVQVVFDAADPDRLAEFWAEALGYQLEPPPPGYETWEDWAREHDIPESEWGNATALVDPTGEGPRIFIQRVPEPKTAKNRMHLDLKYGAGIGDPDERRTAIASAVERLEALGATRFAEHEELGAYWIVMQDPEGNEFCVT